MPDRAAILDCAMTLRDRDRDRFVLALTAPRRRRDAVFVLGAFNAELEHIRDVVVEPTMGVIRLKWWLDTVAALYGGGRADTRVPMVRLLTDLIAAERLPRAVVETMIEARQADYADEPFADRGAMIDHAEATAGGLAELWCRALGADDDAAIAAARAGGSAFGLVGHIRGTPRHLKDGRLMLPADALTRAGVDVDGLISGSARRDLHGVVAGLSGAIDDLVATARGQARQASRKGAPAYLHASVARAMAATLAEAGDDPFAPTVQRDRARLGRLLARRTVHRI